MNYEIVTLEEKTVVGVSTITGNMEPDMGEKIGELWKDIYERGIYETIQNKANAHAIGLYSDYNGTKYCASAAIEVSKNANPELTAKTIPAGKYAKFSVKGNMYEAVANAWQEIWEMDLDRSFTADFEEYLNDDMENAEIDIYVALK